MLGGVEQALMTLVNTRIRIQDSGPRRAGTGGMGNSELCIGLLLPGTAYQLLLTAGCLLPAAYCLPPAANCPLPAGYCLLHLGGRAGGSLRPYHSLGQDVIPGRERKTQRF
jgi:hypothetical protein